ncbi:MAG TPA: response regulator transcription factor [Chloroflexota bacterium]|nr:response regulator transcription factor [Chloroflexota bacterium]
MEDEPQLLRTLRLTLSRYGFDVQEAATGSDALAALFRWHPDVILLDLGLPDVDGLDLVRQIRSAGSPIRIVVLTARGGERDKVLALDLGADDYLTKPFSMDELLARIRVALRHLGPPSASSVHDFGDLRIDFVHRQVYVRGQEVKLSPTEWEILKALVAEPNRVLTHKTLLRQVWGPAYGEEEHYLHVYVANLRKKIEADSHNPRYVITEPGVGYRFRAD